MTTRDPGTQKNNEAFVAQLLRSADPARIEAMSKALLDAIKSFESTADSTKSERASALIAILGAAVVVARHLVTCTCPRCPVNLAHEFLECMEVHILKQSDAPDAAPASVH